MGQDDTAGTAQSEAPAGLDPAAGTDEHRAAAPGDHQRLSGRGLYRQVERAGRAEEPPERPVGLDYGRGL